MKFFDENFSQEIPTCIKCLRKKKNLKQNAPKKLDFLGALHNEDFIIYKRQSKNVQKWEFKNVQFYSFNTSFNR